MRWRGCRFFSWTESVRQLGLSTWLGVNFPWVVSQELTHLVSMVRYFGLDFLAGKRRREVVGTFCERSRHHDLALHLSDGVGFC